MIAEKQPKSGWEAKNEALKAEIAALVAEIERIDSEHGARAVPQYWELGAKLRLLRATLEEKYSLANGTDHYYRGLRINKYFASLSEAGAFRGSLKSALTAARKGIKGRGPQTKETAARALIKAAEGDVREALLLLIKEGHCNVHEALGWLQNVDAEQNRIRDRQLIHLH